MIFEDQLAALEADSKKVGTQGGELDFALLVDGLAAEREQGITIDVAYRFFSTDKRKFIVADTPGHEQYTRNMVTGASTADLAVILIDARKGVLTQTRRHSYLVSLLGIRHVVLAINKMDLVGYSQETLRRDRRRLPRVRAADRARRHRRRSRCRRCKGDNIIERSDAHALVHGPDADGVPRDRRRSRTTARHRPFRMPVQWVNRPNLDFRGFAGTIVERHRSHAATRCACCRRAAQSTVTRIVDDGRRPRRGRRRPVGHADARRRDRRAAAATCIAAADAPPAVADQFEATIVWMDDEPMLPGRPYWLKIGTQTVTATHHRRRSTRSTSTRWSTSRPRRSS